MRKTILLTLMSLSASTVATAAEIDNLDRQYRYVRHRVCFSAHGKRKALIDALTAKKSHSWDADPNLFGDLMGLPDHTLLQPGD